MDTIKELIKLLGIDKAENNYAIYILLIIFAIGWLFSKAKEVGEWKGLFSKDRTEEIRQARDLLKDGDEEFSFYEEAMRQEMFYNLIGIQCSREYREAYQRLVMYGIVSIKDIRRAYRFVKKNNENIEIQFSWVYVILGFFLSIVIIISSIAIVVLVSVLLLNFSLDTFLRELFSLSLSMLYYSISIKLLQPIEAVQIIEKRLKNYKQNERHSASPPENIDAALEQNTQNS